MLFPEKQKFGLHSPDNSDVAFKAEMRKLFATLNNSFVKLYNEMKKQQREIKSKFETVVTEKIVEFELQNHSRQHRLNRFDVVLTGLSDHLDNLKDIANYLCVYLKVDVTPEDIQSAMYIKRLSAILVRFTDISKLDKLMSAYLKSKSLKVSDIIGGNDDIRVYLNDNYSVLVGKLMRILWKLKRLEN